MKALVKERLSEGGADGIGNDICTSDDYGVQPI